jgi:hypothetical protein
LLEKRTGAHVPKRQVEELTVRAARRRSVRRQPDCAGQLGNKPATGKKNLVAGGRFELPTKGL